MIRDRKSQNDEKMAICIFGVQLFAWGAIYGPHKVLFLCAYLRCTLSDVIAQIWLMVYETVLLFLQKPRNSLLCRRLQKVKVNVSACTIWYPTRPNEGLASLFLNLCTRWRWVTIFTSQPIYPCRKSPRYLQGSTKMSSNLH
jgi:hypothetical protein